jgi:D-aminopeptidase
MKIDMLTDLEGVAGVSRPDHAAWNGDNQSLGQELALHLSPARARRLIKETATEACRNDRSILPLRLDPPYELEVRRTPGHDGPRFQQPGARAVDHRTVVYRAEHIWQLPV